MLSRRTLLATAGASVLAPKAAWPAPFRLRAAPVTTQILPEGEGATDMLGFNGATPGPILRVAQGDVLDLIFENQIGAPSSVHWHGIRIDNAMDGASGLTQEPAPHGGTFAYRFQCPDAGTYWYHAHNRSWEQVAKGLYGPLIIEETAPPDVDHDIPVMVDDFRLEASGALAGGFGAMHDFAHAGRLGNFARIFADGADIRRGDRVRLRLINVATARSFFLYVSGVEGKIVALDGMPLPAPRPIEDMLLAPAQRLDIIADVTGPIAFSMWTQNDPFELGGLPVSGDRDRRQADIAPLPAARIPKPGPHDRAIELRMQGGAMGRRHDGDDIWSFNGVSGLTEAPFARLRRNETVKLTLINDTAFAHGIHLHGHHFHEISADGAPGAFRDTTLVEPGESREILCTFDNPGKWLLHCHMLGHQAAGMKTWLEVA